MAVFLECAEMTYDSEWQEIFTSLATKKRVYDVYCDGMKIFYRSNKSRKTADVPSDPAAAYNLVMKIFKEDYNIYSKGDKSSIFKDSVVETKTARFTLSEDSVRLFLSKRFKMEREQVDPKLVQRVLNLRAFNVVTVKDVLFDDDGFIKSIRGASFKGRNVTLTKKLTGKFDSYEKSSSTKVQAGKFFNS